MATETQEVLASMLTENTGRHMLDSGGAYGRNWERNQGLSVEDFLAAPDRTLRFTQYGIEVTLDLFHWLDERLEYDKEITDLFHETFLEETDPDGEKNYLQNIQEFPTWLQRRGYEVPADVEFQGMSENSYNHDCLLSQTIQYTLLYIEQFPEDSKSVGDWFVALEIHGGCDVRGGYTKPRFFRVCEDPYDMFRIADASITTKEPLENPRQQTIDGSKPLGYLSWFTDDAYHWYGNGSPAPDLKDMAYKSLEDKEDTDEDLQVLYYDENAQGFVQFRGRLIGLE